MNAQTNERSQYLKPLSDDFKAELNASRQDLTKIALTAIGFLLTGIGLLGVFLPGIPTTGPVLMAAFCFAKGNPPLEAWLREHKWFRHCFTFGQRCAEAPRRTKAVALVSMWTSVSISSAAMYVGFSNPTWPIVLTVCGALVGSWCICVWKLGSAAPSGEAGKQTTSLT